MKMPMRIACLVESLILACLLLTPMVSVGGGRPKNAILIVSRSRVAAEESVARALAQQVFHLLDQRGLSQGVPILLYHFEKPQEREHCTAGLKIAVSDLPCAALVEVDSQGIPLRVKKKIPRVAATPAAAASLLASLDGGTSPPTAANPTSSPLARPSAIPVSLKKRVPMRPDAGIRLRLGIGTNDPAKGSPPREGCRIDRVISGSNGQRAGLKVGDILLRIGGMSVDNSDEIRAALSKTRTGQPIPLTIKTSNGEATLMYTFSAPTAIQDFEIVEGVGLPGCVEIGNSLRTVVDRLGKPDAFEKDDSGGVWARYGTFGIQVHFNSSELVTGIRFEWPFVGQTASGVRTDGNQVDAYSAYGKPGKDEEVAYRDGVLLTYKKAGIIFLLDPKKNIFSIVTIPPSRKK